MDLAVVMNSAEEGQVFEVFRMFQATPGDQRRGGEDLRGRRSQAPADQRRVLVAEFAHAQCHVHPLVEQVDPAVGQEDFQLDLRVSFEKPRQQVGQVARSHGHRCGKAQPATRLDAQLGDHLFGHLRFQQQVAAVLQVAFADLRERQLACRAVQQAHLKALLQLGDAPRQARLGNPRLASGRGEAAAFHHLGEVVEVVEVVGHAGAPLGGKTDCPMCGTNSHVSTD
ncbi:hypothetical protein PAERUG_E16_London_17_VIM_2_04_14_05175 [Pseudomonas aeruginosa]|nr:hypothetical protein PAERUG_E16_London_17_VIM_2_04_14_05175 [Pseudomonas aeruginosa]